jgi:O-methyltransferase
MGFDDAWAFASAHTLLDVTRARLLYDLAERCLVLPGAFCEFGVYRGGSAAILAAVAGGRTLHLYDTFAGIAESDAAYDNGHADGDFGGEGLEAAVRGPAYRPVGLYFVTIGRLPAA